MAVLREFLTFGPPPNEATCWISIWCANVAFRHNPKGAGISQDPVTSRLLFIKRQPTRRLWSRCRILSMKEDHQKRPVCFSQGAGWNDARGERAERMPSSTFFVVQSVLRHFALKADNERDHENEHDFTGRALFS